LSSKFQNLGEIFDVI